MTPNPSPWGPVITWPLQPQDLGTGSHHGNSDLQLHATPCTNRSLPGCILRTPPLAPRCRLFLPEAALPIRPSPGLQGRAPPRSGLTIYPQLGSEEPLTHQVPALGATPTCLCSLSKVEALGPLGDHVPRGEGLRVPGPSRQRPPRLALARLFLHTDCRTSGSNMVSVSGSPGQGASSPPA